MNKVEFRLKPACHVTQRMMRGWPKDWSVVYVKAIEAVEIERPQVKLSLLGGNLNPIELQASFEVPEFYFVSFGSDIWYRRLSRKTIRELLEIYPTSKYKVFGPNDLCYIRGISGCAGDDLRRYAKKHPRGYGYWKWKPCLIGAQLEINDDSALIVYVDSRVGIPKERIQWLEDFANRPELDIAAWQMSNVERIWTTADLLNLFDVPVDSEIAISGQYAAGFFAVRNNSSSRELIREWARILDEESPLCRDDPSRMANHPDFQQNRHDQSVFSLLIKSCSEKVSVLTLSDEEIMNQTSIRPHGKPHPFFSRVAKKLKNIVKSCI